MSSEQNRVKPFLKWAGNKTQLLERLKPLLPEARRLIEPFAGSGAVFLNTEYSRYLLADSNQDLISLYHYLQKEGLEFIKYCRPFFEPENNNKPMFYELRNLFNTTHETRLKAALFLYLNKHAYNGLCRYNSQGGYNVSFGRYLKPYFPEKEMQLFFKRAKKATFSHKDFNHTLKLAKSGDVVYCDPPYMPLSLTANFTSYQAGGFGLDQHLELADWAKTLAKKGISVLVSNHATDFIQKAYKGARLLKFEVQRFISCKGDKREKVMEVLALFAAKT